MPDLHVHWTTVIGGTAAYFALGALWYGILADPWSRAIGLTREDVRADDARWIYGLQLLATFALVLLATWVLHDWAGVHDAASGLLAGLVLGVIMALACSGDFLYEARRRSVALFLINSGYRVAGMLVVGLVVGLLH